MPQLTAIHTVGDYSLYPLHICSEEAIAGLFAKICQRGNPILQGKPPEDLKRLGSAFYRKSVGSPCAMVFLKGGTEPVALFFGWDAIYGPAWEGTAGPPEALFSHAAIGDAAWAPVLPLQSALPGKMLFMAFSGVALPHPGSLLLVMEIVSMLASWGAGYDKCFGYAVHPKTIEQTESLAPEPGFRQVWRIKYSDIEVADPAVREELASAALSPGFALCSATDLKWCVSKMDQGKDDKEWKDVLHALRPPGAQMAAFNRRLLDDDGLPMPAASL